MAHKKYYRVPNPIVNKKEQESLKDLTARYEKLSQPNAIVKAGKGAVNQIGKIVPKPVKRAGQNVKDAIAGQELFNQAMEVVIKGYSTIQQYGSKATLSDKAIIKSINKQEHNFKINSLEEICLVRGYHISKVVNKFRTRDIWLACVEGGATGFFGFAGIPFNLVLSTFIYYRAVQGIAMHYGYDVKNNPSELVIAGEVFMNALSPTSKSADGISGSIGKIMILTETTAIKQTAGKTWADMAAHGGVGLLITQMRALANKAAQKALEKAGEKGLEESIFKGIFEQIGKKLTLKTVKSGAPVVGTFIGAAFDTAQMRTVLDYADVFYNKRFLLEKEVRINILLEGNSEIVADIVE